MNYHRDKDYLASEKQFRNIFLKRVNLILSYHPRGGTCLEIGCSTGVMLDILKEAPTSLKLRGAQWETWGVEPSGSANTARLKGHKIINAIFEKAKLPENYFDLAVMNHTLEHMDDPGSVLKRVKTLLKEEGIVFVDVPNFGSLSSKILGKKWSYLLPEEHKHQFTKESLTKLLKDSGFRVIHWESRSGIFEYTDPFLELWQAFVGFKKRFFTDLFAIPYDLFATLLNMGDSMSIISKKYKQT